MSRACALQQEKSLQGEIGTQLESSPGSDEDPALLNTVADKVKHKIAKGLGKPVRHTEAHQQPYSEVETGITLIFSPAWSKISFVKSYQLIYPPSFEA